MSWHADPSTLERYGEGSLGPVTASSIEAHVISCETCRHVLSSAMIERSGARLARVLDGVVDVVDGPERSLLERAMVKVGVRDHVARLLAATPSLQVSWFAALALVLGTAVLAAGNSHGGGRLFFLLVAPVLPVTGVAAAFGPRVDPAHEVATAAPMHGLSLLLVRSVAVLGTTVLLAGIATLALPHTDWQAAAWLLPALGLSATTLALATWWRPVTAAVVTTLSWVSSTVFVERGADVQDRLVDRLLVFHATGQLFFVVVVVVAGTVVARRRDSLALGRLA